MKTLIIYNALNEGISQCIVDGDYSHFHGACINGGEGTGHEQEFCDWFYEHNTGKCRFELSEDKSFIENKEWDKVAVVTWVP